MTFKTQTSKPRFDMFDDEESARDFFEETEPDSYEIRIFDDNGDEVDPDKMFG